MARIVGVTFETISHAQAGRFSIPRQVAALLGIGDDDPIEARVLWEGQQVELSARLASGLELYARAGDPATEGLASLPPKTPILVTVWASEEARNADQAASRGRDKPWTDDEFRQAFEQRVGSHCPSRPPHAVGRPTRSEASLRDGPHRSHVRRLREGVPDRARDPRVCGDR